MADRDIALLALLLAAIGPWVSAYLVTQRTREIIRIALARPCSVLGLVAGSRVAERHGHRARPIVACGLPHIETQLFGIRPRDPATLLAVPLALLAIATIASYIPARRATRVDPLTALRAE